MSTKTCIDHVYGGVLRFEQAVEEFELGIGRYVSLHVHADLGKVHVALTRTSGAIIDLGLLDELLLKTI